jgi:hypothetical protein
MCSQGNEGRPLWQDIRGERPKVPLGRKSSLALGHTGHSVVNGALKSRFILLQTVLLSYHKMLVSSSGFLPKRIRGDGCYRHPVEISL